MGHLLHQFSARTTQPQYPVRIDRNNPLARSLVIAQKQDGVNLASDVANIVAMQRVVTKYGIGVGHDKKASGVDQKVDVSGPYTVMAFCRNVGGTGTNFPTIFGNLVYASESSNSGYQLSIRSSTGDSRKAAFICCNNNAVSTYQLLSNSTFTTANQDFSIAGVSTPSGRSLYINGLLETTKAATTTLANSTGYFVGDNSGGTEDVKAALVLGWNRELSAAEINAVNDNPWALFEPIEDVIYVPSAVGGTTISGNPITWQWEQNSSSFKQKLETSPQDWQWFTQTGTIKEYISTSPVTWEWSVVTGSIQVGSATTISGNPIDWQWEQNSASFKQRIEANVAAFEWSVGSTSIKENISSNPVNWEWSQVSGQILGTDTVSGNPVDWTWEITSGSIKEIVERQQQQETIGGKPEKKRKKLPYYESEYKSRIDLDEIVRDDSRSVADVLDAITDDSRRSIDGVDNVSAIADRQYPQISDSVGNLLDEVKAKSAEISVIEFPQVEESEGFNEEAAVIMLLLAA